MPRALIDMTGRRSGRLVVIEQAGRYRDLGEATWRCMCDCGTETVTTGSALRRGAASSCGCRQREVTAELNKTHGDRVGRRVTPEYRAWANLHGRCTNAAAKGYHNYGGRGISVCGRWSKFAAFLEDMGRKPTPSHSIERIDNDGNYEPGNCRWAVRRDQIINRRVSLVVVFRGKPMTLTEAIREAGRPITRSCATKRLRKGWPIEKVLFAPKARTGVAA